jgi:hypothetical protein
LVPGDGLEQSTSDSKSDVLPLKLTGESLEAALVRPERFKRSISEHDAGVQGNARFVSMVERLTISRYSFGAGDGLEPVASRLQVGCSTDMSFTSSCAVAATVVKNSTLRA